jgi:prefoldin subunit 5
MQMFKKVLAQTEIYTPKLTKADFDKNESKVQQEITQIEKKYPTYKQIAVDVTFDGKRQKLDKFLKLLKIKLSDLNEIKNVRGAYDTPLFGNIGGKNVEVSTVDAQESLKREVASLEKQIQLREQALAELDDYVVSLLVGESATLNAHTSAKFIKIAEDDMVKEADEEIEDYYNSLYDDSEGSPDFGTALEHPKETRNELTTKIHHHRFKKK